MGRSLRHGACATLVLLGSLALATGAAERNAVPLYTPPPETPVEAAGRELTPEVAVRVRVDAAGRVRDVEIVKIDPASDLDERFRKTTRETLLRWRYAPAMKAGLPVESTLQWTVRFPRRNEQTTAERSRFWRNAARPEEAIGDYRKRILELPAERRSALLAQLVEQAVGHLDRDKTHRFSSTQVRAWTDSSFDGTAEKLASNVETTFHVLQDLLSPTIDPNPEPYRVVALLFATRASFEALVRDSMGVDWAEGFYNPAGLLAFHMEMPTESRLTSTLLHEATHAYIDRYVARPGVLFPRWLDEGFAEYIGNSEIRKKQLIPGRTRRSDVYSTLAGYEIDRSAAQFSLEQVKAAVRKGTALTIREMIDASRGDFYGDRRNMYYAMSWLLVHFLRHEQESWADDQFPSLVLYVAEGIPAAQALRKIYGDPAELEPRFRKYVLAF